MDSNTWEDIDQFIDIDTDSQDNIIIAGYRQSNQSVAQLILFKYTNNGNLATGWPNYFTSPLATADLAPLGPGGTAVDNQDNIYACGSWTDATYPRWVLLGYTPDGSDLDGNESGGVFPQEITDFYGKAWDIAVDSQDDIIIVGSRDIEQTDSAIHIRKYHFDENNNTLTLSWSRDLDPDTQHDVAYGVTVDSSDAVIIVGATDNGADTDLLIAKYQSDGTLLWGGPIIQDINGTDKAFTIAVNEQDNIYLGGISGGHWLLEYRSGSDGNLLKEKSWSLLNDSWLYGLDLQDNALALTGIYYNGSDYDWHVEFYDLVPFSWPMFLPAIVTP
jgi:hypothetical protein